MDAGRALDAATAGARLGVPRGLPSTPYTGRAPCSQALAAVRGLQGRSQSRRAWERNQQACQALAFGALAGALLRAAGRRRAREPVPRQPMRPPRASRVPAGFLRTALMDKRGQPRLARGIEAFVRLVLRLAVDADALRLQLMCGSYADLAWGRLQSLRLEVGRVRRLLKLQSFAVSGGNLDLGYKPLLGLSLPFVMLLMPKLFFPILLAMLWLPGHSADWSSPKDPRRQERNLVEGGAHFTATFAPEDLNDSSLWRLMLSAALKEIVEYSIAGLVALPREVEGQFTSATSFSLQAVDVADRSIVMSATAHLPDEATFSFKLRTGVTLADVEGSKCIFWDDPAIRVAPIWPLPEMWAPIGGFAGRRLPGWMQLERVHFPEDGGITVEGTLGRRQRPPSPSSSPKGLPSPGA